MAINENFSLQILDNRSSFANCATHPNENFGVFRILLSTPGIILNTLFILTMARNESIRKPLILLTFLSFGDLLLAMKGFALGINDFYTEATYNITKLECFYQRPHLSLIIWGTLTQSTGTFLVAIERAVAILLPYYYFMVQKTKVLLTICFVALLFVLGNYFVGIIIASQSNGEMVFHDLCFPSTVITETYSGFLFLYPATVGCSAIGCYLFTFAYVFRTRFYKKKNQDRFEEVQRRKQMWLLKICSVLALSTFAFAVVPYIILFMGRFDRCPTSLLYFVRQYVTFLQSINSFFGMTLSLLISSELRSAFRITLCCSSIRSEAIASRVKLGRLSSTKMTDIDSYSSRLSTQI